MKNFFKRALGLMDKTGFTIGWTWNWPGSKKKIEQSKRLYDQAMKEHEERENERSKKDKDKLHV